MNTVQEATTMAVLGAAGSEHGEIWDNPEVRLRTTDDAGSGGCPVVSTPRPKLEGHVSE